jgi:tetratricopeptide repeat protein 21B
LLLSDIYIQGSKYDLASQLCNLCSTHNASCGRAWENLGLIYEREHAYRDASQHYEKAWELANRNSPGVGFRLAFNYLKAKRHIECILVARHVLSINENYPKIHKEVLEKAQLALRP